MRVPELPHMRELSAGLRDLTLQLPHLGSCQTRINTGFSANFLISISQAAQCLGTQVAHAALGRRGFLRDAGFCLACRLGRPLGNVPPGRSGPALGVRDRTGQAAFLRSARAGPSTQGETPRPYRGAGGPGARWAPFRTGLRCHFGRCWASATGRQHPRRQPRPEATAFPYFKKRGDGCPPLGVPPRPGVLLVEGASAVPPRPLPGLSASQRAPRSLHFFHRLRRLRP